ncbi:hypothetical protein NE237_020754 [Protea cynaroides]|uniref:Uncharacterized protein n=1 Tax=Protea cynaroides TaxID=273540 RepID=A0A9Q0K1Y9_9MAGN|nr:hypothetical protein NE237_020754 [Protea cynaroides]
MESSQLFGDNTEECSSSESGWTMYIGSPLHLDDAQDDNGEADEDYDNDEYDDDDNGKEANDDSDDSMASDASTGPNHGEGEHGMTDFKNEQEEDDEKCYSYTKAYKQKEKKTEERGRDAEKQGSVPVANSATSPRPVHSGVKVRKTRMEKGI